VKYSLLGRTGVRVSQLCFGAMSFGTTADEDTSKKMFNRCRDVGINFFDCANSYGHGEAERILGRCLSGCRDEIVVCTKVSGVMGDGVNDHGLSRRHMMMQVEASLTRLQTDRIDVYFLHHLDPSTPLEETLRALDDMVRQGKIVYPAVSNWAAWQIATALGISKRQGLAAFECIQPMYNLVKRQVEVEILPLAAAENLGVITYSPLGAGLLTGKYSTTKRPDSGRILESPLYIKRYEARQYYEIAERFTAYAAERGYHPATLAVAWAMTNPVVTAPIIGARNLEQLEPSLAALDVEMTPEWRQEISALSIDPPPATDRTEEVM